MKDQEQSERIKKLERNKKSQQNNLVFLHFQSITTSVLSSFTLITSLNKQQSSTKSHQTIHLRTRHKMQMRPEVVHAVYVHSGAA